MTTSEILELIESNKFNNKKLIEIGNETQNPYIWWKIIQKFIRHRSTTRRETLVLIEHMPPNNVVLCRVALDLLTSTYIY
jgi:hypothetical protein